MSNIRELLEDIFCPKNRKRIAPKNYRVNVSDLKKETTVKTFTMKVDYSGKED